MFLFRQRRDGPSELVIRRKHPVVAMPVLPRRRHEIGEPVQKLKRREFDDAVNSPPRPGLGRHTRSIPLTNHAREPNADRSEQYGPFNGSPIEPEPTFSQAEASTRPYRRRRPGRCCGIRKADVAVSRQAHSPISLTSTRLGRRPSN